MFVLASVISAALTTTAMILTQVCKTLKYRWQVNLIRELALAENTNDLTQLLKTLEALQGPHDLTDHPSAKPMAWESKGQSTPTEGGVSSEPPRPIIAS